MFSGGFFVQKTASLAVVLFALLMLCGCGGNSIRQQLYADGTMQTAPSATPSGSIQQEMIVEAPTQTASTSKLFGNPKPAKVGSQTKQGATVTGQSADGTFYYATKTDAMGKLAAEYAYSGYDDTLLFQTDYRYDKNGLISDKTATALADKAFGYVGQTDGRTTACQQIYTAFENGRESYVFYRDFQGQEVALIQKTYHADGTYVNRLYEYGNLVFVRTYAADGSVLYADEGAPVTVGMPISFGGDLVNGTVTHVNENGEFTVLFKNQKHKMSDSTEYFDLDLYTLFAADYRPLVIVYQSKDTKICEYQVTYAADRSYTQAYYELGRFICTLHYDAADQLLQVTAADGSVYDANAVIAPAIGDKIGDGIVCQVNEDSSYTIAYFDKPYTTLAGNVITGTTMYSFFTADNMLLGNKYFYDGVGIAEYNLYYEDDGDYSVNIFENGQFMLTVEYDRNGNAVRASDANGNKVQ